MHHRGFGVPDASEVPRVEHLIAAVNWIFLGSVPKRQTLVRPVRGRDAWCGLSRSGELVKISEVFVSPARLFVGLQVGERDEPHWDAIQLGRHTVWVTLGKVHTIDASLNLDSVWSDTHADDTVLAKEQVWTQLRQMEAEIFQRGDNP